MSISNLCGFLFSKFHYYYYYFFFSFFEISVPIDYKGDFKSVAKLFYSISAHRKSKEQCNPI